MTHPDWALKYKTKGTELRCIRGKYYLYRISSFWDKERKVTRKVTHEMIGRISEQHGFILKGEKTPKSPKLVKSMPQKPIFPPSVKEFGASAFLMETGDDILQALLKIFPDSGASIFALACFRLLYQSPLKNMADHYESSFLSHVLGSLNLSKNTLTELISNVGKNRPAIAQFLRHFLTGSEHIVFDTTHIISQSQGMQMNQYGYNSPGDFDPQVNLFYMFSTDKQEPAYYRIFPGNIHGIKALKLTIKESNLHNCVTIGDKGFFSEENISLLEEAGLQYILPLKRNSAWIDYSRLSSRSYTDAYDGHFLYAKRPIFYYQIYHEDKNIFVFMDPRLRLEEESAYLNRIENNIEGYTMEGYSKKELTFGTFSVVTNLKDETPQNIYKRYKLRAEVETVFDTYKNLLQADRSYMHSDDSFEAWIFINHIATLLYYKIFNLLKENDLLSKVSPKDLLTRLKWVQKVNIQDSWFTSEINSKSKKLFDALNINVTCD